MNPVWSNRYGRYIDPAPIPGFPNYYATYDGKIWSEKTNSFLKPSYNIKGYERIYLYCKGNGGRKRCFVHRLVAIVFHENPENKKIVDHDDEYIFNNHGDNLYWRTAAENVKRSIELRRSKQEKDVPF